MKYVMHLVLNEYGVKHVIVANVTEVGLILALIKTKSKRAGCNSLHRVLIQN
ncbi:hypothetical protein [Wolbachia pipientis]|uniref:hypothetical protein n=1 Tax=Wolbachia pipientis TaxID=955 RepID=UPI00035F0A6F|nr:GDSL family lipase [Wolbachia pipientis wAus]QEK89632.1 GDSL family lipase [Wolbachia endosymbiont of Chrysomya megacephala]